MASRSPMAIATKKARMLSIKDYNYAQNRGIAGEYQNGDSVPGPGHVDCVAARINSQLMRERRAWELLASIGLVDDDSWTQHEHIVRTNMAKKMSNHWSKCHN